MSEQVNYISLFCGCGGSSYGYKKSGFKGLLGIDNNSLCCENYSLNFPDVKVWNKDIKQILPSDILLETGLSKGGLTLLDSSPPCQGFSIAGRREVLDFRNELFFETKKFILGLLPKIFVIENVDGLIQGKMRGVFNKIIEELQKTPYKIKWKSLNTIYYGVPQSRQRLIIMGVRNDLGKEPIFPDKDEEIKLIGDVIPNIDFHSRGQFDKKLKGVNTLAYTVTKTPSMFFIEKGLKRKPTIEELKCLQGFPESFRLSGSFNEVWGMIGNSVPPPLSERIGRVIINNILS